MDSEKETIEKEQQSKIEERFNEEFLKYYMQNMTALQGDFPPELKKWLKEVVYQTFLHASMTAWNMCIDYYEQYIKNDEQGTDEPA